MDTKWWGPHAWQFLFSIALNYEPTPESFYYTKQLFVNMGYTLPCKYCRHSYKQFTKELNIDNYLHSRKALTYWLYLVHNKVNDKLRAQGNIIAPNPPFDIVCQKYEKHRASCDPTTLSCSIPTTTTLTVANTTRRPTTTTSLFYSKR